MHFDLSAVFDKSNHTPTFGYPMMDYSSNSDANSLWKNLSSKILAEDKHAFKRMAEAREKENKPFFSSLAS